MKFWLGLLGLTLTIPRILLMVLAYVIVSIAAQLERLQEWVDTGRGIPIVQVGEETIDIPHELDDVAARVLWHRGQALMLEEYIAGRTHPAPPLNDSMRCNHDVNTVCARCVERMG